MGEWDNGVLGCFGNCSVCIITFLVPCHQVGKVSEALGDGYCCQCLLFMIPVVDIFILVSQRGRMRDRQGIEGGLVTDLLLSLFCPICVICQLGNEVEKMTGGMAKALPQEEMEMARM